MLRSSTTILAAALSLLPSLGLLADGMIYISDPGIEVRLVRPRPPFRPPLPQFPLEVTRHRVAVEIDENLARTRVEETFFNPNDRQLEGTYLFPLPPEAAVSNFTLRIGGREVAGEILEKEKARRIYEDIVRQVRDPGLLEYMERGLFRARVFPIPARGGVDVAIEYSEALPRAAGVTSYRYPLDTGKYSAGNYRDVVLDVRLRSSAPLRTIHCPSHEAVAVSRLGEREARVTFEAKELRADKDFLLTWNVSEDALAPVVITHRGVDAEGFFFLSFLPRPERAKTLPKDVVFVVDTSGSMTGPKMEQARGALRYCVSNLNPGDRFNIVDFATEARRFRDGLAEANDESRRAAEAYIAELKARGGTNIEEGLRLGLAALGDPARLGMVVLLTDGEPTIGYTRPEEILRTVKEQGRGNRRVFVFGVGNDLNAKLLDLIARETRGTTEYIRPEENIEVPVSKFYDKIDSPVLTDLRLEFPSGGVEDLYPRPLPDLFRGEQLEVYGRYVADGQKTVVLRGKLQGEERVFEYSLAFAGGQNGYLPRLWAGRKVGYLLEQMRLSGESSEVKEEVIRLSKRHGIITPYTSYLILEEERLVRLQPGAQPELAYRLAARDAVAPAGAGAAPVVQEAAKAFEETRGESGVAASRQLGELRRGRGAEVDRFIESEVNAGGVRIQRLEGWTFYLQGSRWIDAGLTDKDLGDATKLRRVKYLGDDYFALLREEPGIGKLLGVGPEVTFLWKGKVVSVEG